MKNDLHRRERSGKKSFAFGLVVSVSTTRIRMKKLNLSIASVSPEPTVLVYYTHGALQSTISYIYYLLRPESPFATIV
jgi:hypothetical protein